jgi:tetratricopeptide (TPR) repeat protein
MQTDRKPRTNRPKNRNIPRRWCLPPAIVREPNETLEGIQILDEFPNELGLVLWTALRDVNLWAATPPKYRDGLFSPSAAAKRMDSITNIVELDTPEQMCLAGLVAVTAAPESVSEEATSLVCVELSKWAHDHNAMGTAVQFAQAAAFANALDASAARRVGNLVIGWANTEVADTRRQRLGRAETWLRRAITLGRQTRAWDAYGWAYVDLGRLYRSRGKRNAAVRCYQTAMRTARRTGYMTVRAAALHGLMLASIELRDFDRAEQFAKAAQRAYGRESPGLPGLLHDKAYLLIMMERYDRATPILQRLLPARTDPEDRAFTLALIARATAGTGDTEAYRAAWSDAWMLLTRPGGSPEDGERILLELSRAATAAKDRPRMDQAVRLHLQWRRSRVAADEPRGLRQAPTGDVP